MSSLSFCLLRHTSIPKSGSDHRSQLGLALISTRTDIESHAQVAPAKCWRKQHCPCQIHTSRCPGQCETGRPRAVPLRSCNGFCQNCCFFIPSNCPGSKINYSLLDHWNSPEVPIRFFCCLVWVLFYYFLVYTITNICGVTSIRWLHRTQPTTSSFCHSKIERSWLSCWAS